MNLETEVRVMSQRQSNYEPIGNWGLHRHCAWSVPKHPEHLVHSSKHHSCSISGGQTPHMSHLSP